jgi:hypothetical protein
MIPTTTEHSYKDELENCSRNLNDIANELKNSVQTNNQNQKSLQTLQESVAEVETCCSEKQANESTKRVAAQIENVELKIELENLKTKCGKKDFEIEDLQQEINKMKNIEFLMKKLVTKYDAQVGKLNSLMNSA